MFHFACRSLPPRISAHSCRKSNDFGRAALTTTFLPFMNAIIEASIYLSLAFRGQD